MTRPNILTQSEASRVTSGGFCDRYPQLVNRQERANTNSRVAFFGLVLLNVSLTALIVSLLSRR